jgi:hypothetical protein
LRESLQRRECQRRRGAEIAAGAEDFALRTFGELRCQNRVAGGEGQNPGAFRESAGDRDHDSNEIGQREFVAAKHRAQSIGAPQQFVDGEIGLRRRDVAG